MSNTLVDLLLAVGLCSVLQIIIMIQEGECRNVQSFSIFVVVVIVSTRSIVAYCWLLFVISHAQVGP